ncbi:MAG: hypothetical protein ACRD2N_13280 [Vicinamibacterales bacterium]
MQALTVAALAFVSSAIVVTSIAAHQTPVSLSAVAAQAPAPPQPGVRGGRAQPEALDFSDH